MARSIILTLAWGTVAMLQVAQASLLLAPRTLRPQSLRPQMLLGASSSSPSCNNIDKSCADCYSVLSCSNLNGVFVPISTTTCPTSAPYCLDGACVTSLSSTDTCYKKPSVDFTCIGDGYFPSPSNCKKYYLCVDSLPYEYDCSSYSNTVYSHEKAMCVPSSEATCSVVSCTTALLGKYQPWAQEKSVYFVCTDTNATHAYVSDCGSDHQINTTTGYCELACLREGRLPAEDPKSYYECVQTAAQTFVGPTLATCPGNSTYSATTQRCVHGSASDSDEENEYPREDLFEPNDSVPESLYNIPANMLIGSASAAYQIEGAWNTSRKSPSIWDVFFHSRPTAANGDVACDSYHRWQEDIEMLKTLKMQSYRLSLSWTRLLPGGSQADGYDSDGVDYYNNVINGLIDAGITPIITLYHWDLPQIYQDDGGWLNPAVVDRFADFADFAFSTFGDRIKIWVILNEPNQYCPNGYETNQFAPGVTQIGTGGYLCMHHSILAHAKAWHVYDDKYRASQQGRVGSSPSFPWNEPDGESEEAQEAAERGNEFSYGWFMDALFTGDYPVSMRTNVDANSAAEGLSTSRLPTFTAEQKASIIGAIDFVGMNHYASSLTSSGTAKQTDSASIAKDTNTTTRLRDTWVPQPYGGVTPWGLRYALNWLKDRYGKSILVTENGYPGVEGEGTTDPARVGYHSTYMRAVMRAVNEDRCDVFGYTAWSLEDNLEWTVGYRLKFGLVYVDFNDPDRPRTPKDSASFFQKLAETRYVPYVQPTVPL